MKKYTNLYVFAVLSGISTLMRLYVTFFSNFDEESTRSSLQQASSQGFDMGTLNEVILVTKATVKFQTNLINKSLSAILLLAIVALVVFLVKKQFEQASYVYVGYLFGTLLYTTYGFVVQRSLQSLYTDEMMMGVGQNTVLISYIIQIVLFAVFFGLTVFFLLRKPKNRPSLEINSTDI